MKDVSVRDLTIAHADVTYLADYETPSGGGYSVHRGGAVEIEGAENPGKKPPFFSPFYYATTIILPRQARDNHRVGKEHSNRESGCVFLQSFRTSSLTRRAATACCCLGADAYYSVKTDPK